MSDHTGFASRDGDRKSLARGCTELDYICPIVFRTKNHDTVLATFDHCLLPQFLSARDHWKHLQHASLPTFLLAVLCLRPTAIPTRIRFAPLGNFDGMDLHFARSLDEFHSALPEQQIASQPQGVFFGGARAADCVRI
jgi:hypothetical protein